MSVQRIANGFSVTELLVSIVIFSVMMIGIVKVFLIQNRSYAQQDLIASRNENLRLAMDALTTALRQAHYAAPEQSSLLPTWIPSSWVGGSGLTSNPLQTVGATANDPDTISIAACFQQPVATISAGGAAENATTVNLTPATGSLSSLLDTNQRRLIRIGDGEFAHVKSVGSTSITIDTNPTTTTTNDGLSRAYPAGTPICRVDVTTFRVDTSSNRLTRDDNQGAGQQVVAEGIKNLKFCLGAAPCPLGGPFKISLTGQTELRDPMTGALDKDVNQDNVSPETPLG
jgi:Tfp pilus assembly protein PilW